MHSQKHVLIVNVSSVKMQLLAPHLSENVTQYQNSNVIAFESGSILICNTFFKSQSIPDAGSVFFMNIPFLSKVLTQMFKSLI